MKLKHLFLLFAVGSLFSFVLVTTSSEKKVKESKVTIENIKLDKEPMQPFAMTDRNQFNY
ncbi:MAG: hypothetical protein ABJH04_01180 [Cyclobacteriaceae bacterium]